MPRPAPLEGGRDDQETPRPAPLEGGCDDQEMSRPAPQEGDCDDQEMPQPAPLEGGYDDHETDESIHPTEDSTLGQTDATDERISKAEQVDKNDMDKPQLVNTGTSVTVTLPNQMSRTFKVGTTHPTVESCREAATEYHDNSCSIPVKSLAIGFNLNPKDL